MSDPQEAATPSDPHSAEAEEREAWAAKEAKAQVATKHGVVVVRAWKAR